MTYSQAIDSAAQHIEDADVILIGAGAGLSSAAGLVYSGKRFFDAFGDFAKKYGIRDMYSGGFYPFPTPEEKWSWGRGTSISTDMSRVRLRRIAIFLMNLPAQTRDFSRE